MADFGTGGPTPGSANRNQKYFIGGVTPALSGMTLVSMSAHIGAGDTVRLALYSGGALDDITTGITLLEDLGEVTNQGESAGWVQVSSSANVAIPSAGRVWLAVKGSSFTSANAESFGDLDSAVRWFNDNDSSTPWGSDVSSQSAVMPAAPVPILLTYSTDPVAAITSVGDDDAVSDGETEVPVTGVELPTVGAVLFRSGSIEEPQDVSSRSDTGFTWDEVVRGNLPYSDIHHSHALAVGDGSSELTRAVTFSPAAGFAAFPLHPDYASQTLGESVLAGIGEITEGMQLHVPLSLDIGGPVSIEWELVGSYASGRIQSLGTVIDDPIEIPGVEVHDTSEWDDLPASMEPAPDVIPDLFAFAPRTAADTSTQYESNAITIAGIPAGTDIPVSVSGGQYSVSTDGGSTWGAWTTTPATVRLGYQIRVRGTSSPNSSTTTNVTLNAGGRIGTFSITTKAASTSTAIRVPVVDRNGAPVVSRNNLTAVVRASMTSADIRYQTNAASIDGSGMLSLNGPLGTAGTTVSLTLASADRQTVAFWPDCPVVES